MKFYKILLVLIILISQSVTAQEIWTLGTARTVPIGTYETGIFSPLRYGLTRTLELQTHAIEFPVYPSFGVKKYWGKLPYNILLATNHWVYVPSIALNLERKLQLFGYVPGTYAPYGFIATFKNELILSKVLVERTSCSEENYWLSLTLGVLNAIPKQDSANFALPYHILYPRTAIYHDTTVWYVGLDLDGRITSSLDFSADVDFLSIGWGVDYMAIEHKGILLYHATEKLSMAIGYKFIWGNYPVDGISIGIAPVFDIIYRFKFRGKELELFEDKMF